MKEWFYSNFEDPSINCHYDTSKGEFFYPDLNIYGKGHNCAEEIRNHFSKIYEEKDIISAINEIHLESGCYEWAKTIKI